MWGMTTADWIGLASAAGTVLAALFAVRSANASRDTARIMKDQWQRDREDRDIDEWHRDLSLLSSLRDECRVIRYTFTAGSQATLGMPEWEKSRTAVARIDNGLASLLRELEMRVGRLNGMNTMNAEMVWHPERDELMAAARNMTTVDEEPEMQSRFQTFAKRMTESMKQIYEPYLPVLDKATTRLDAIYTCLEEHRPERSHPLVK